MTDLAIIDAAKKEIAEITTPTQAVELDKKVAALEGYLKSYITDDIERKLLEMQCVEARALIARKGQAAILAMREAGELAGHGDKQINSKCPPRTLRTLNDIGLSHRKAALWKLIWAIPDAELQEYFAKRPADFEGGLNNLAALGKPYLKAGLRKAVADAAQPLPDDSIQVIHGDCLDMIAGLEDGSVDLLLTDPPYAVTDNDWDTFGSEQAFLGFMLEWMVAMRPKMADKFHSFVFCDASMTVKIHALLEKAGYPILRQGIWYRPNLAKKRSGSLTFMSAYEPFWHCGNHALNFPDEWGDERFDVQTFITPQSNHTKDRAVHPTQKPLALMDRLVTLGAAHGGLVVDPFCGSGTTAVACKNMDRRCVTSDQSAEYVQIALGRLSNAR